ncbi:MAG: T9SS type A sorting domain-containing protein [Bacteroidota bacterium]|nr:T9SS type A sorting domain-containing protein [Bacteroidota bacterium]
MKYSLQQTQHPLFKKILRINKEKDYKNPFPLKSHGIKYGYILVVLILILTHNIIAQHTFEYILRDLEDDLPGTIFETDQGNFICSVKGMQKVKLIKLSSEGYLIDSISFINPDGFSDLTELTKINDSIFAAFGSYREEGKYFLWYLQFDSVLNILLNEYIPVQYPIAGEETHTIINTDDNFIIATAFDSVHLNTIVFEIDQSGEMINSSSFPDPYTNFPFDIMEDTLNHTYKLFTLRPFQRLHSAVAILDKNLKLISNKSLYPSIHEQNTSLWIDDTTYLLSGKWVDYGKNSEFDLGILKMNNVDSILTSFYFGAAQEVDWPAMHSNLDFSHINNIFYVSYLSQYIPYNFSEVPSFIQISSFDEGLNLRWQRYYGGDAYYIPYSVCATYDSGLLIASSRYDWNIQDMERDVHILKVNKEGLIVGTDEKSTFQTTEAILYPNPGNELINIWISGQYKNTRFQLFDMKGKIIIEEIISGPKGCIHVEQLKPGPYLFRIFNHDGLHEEGKWIKK